MYLSEDGISIVGHHDPSHGVHQHLARNTFIITTMKYFKLDDLIPLALLSVPGMFE